MVRAVPTAGSPTPLRVSPVRAPWPHRAAQRRHRRPTGTRAAREGAGDRAA